MVAVFKIFFEARLLHHAAQGALSSTVSLCGDDQFITAFSQSNCSCEELGLVCDFGRVNSIPFEQRLHHFRRPELGRRGLLLVNEKEIGSFGSLHQEPPICRPLKQSFDGGLGQGGQLFGIEVDGHRRSFV